VKYIILLFLVLILGLALRTYGLDSRSIWLDETFSLFESTGHGRQVDALFNADKKSGVFLKAGDYKNLLQDDAAQGLKDVSLGLLKTDTQPPLYFFMMHFWIRYFGGTVFSVRFFSVLLGVVSIICAFLFASAVFDKKTGLFAALFLAFSPFAVFYAREARNYSLILALVLLNAYFLARFVREGKNILLAGFTLTAGLALYTHYFYIFIFLGYLAYFMLFDFKQAMKNKFYIAFFVSLFLLLPWISAVLINGYNFRGTQWVFGYRAGPAMVIDWIAKSFSSFFIAIGGFKGVFTALNYFLIICLVFFSRALFRRRREFIFCAIMVFLPIVSLGLIDIFAKAYLLKHLRYYTFSFAGLIPLAGYALSSGWQKKIFRPLIIFIFALLMVNSFFVANGYAYKDVSLPRPKNASLWINRQLKDKKGAVILNNTRASVMPNIFYLSDDVMVAPVGSLKHFTDTLKELKKGGVEAVFVVYNIFEDNLSQTLSERNVLSWVEYAGNSGLKQEKIEFSEDGITIFKLN
jgi:uncharacterized membrane protein